MLVNLEPKTILDYRYIKMGLAERHFRTGQEYFDNHMYDKALIEFEKSYGLSQKTELLYDMGLCHRKLGNFEEAIGYYREYLKQQPNAKNKIDVEVALSAMQDLIREKRSSAYKKIMWTSIALSAGGLFIGTRGLYLYEKNGGEKEKAMAIAGLTAGAALLAFGSTVGWLDRRQNHLAIFFDDKQAIAVFGFGY